MSATNRGAIRRESDFYRTPEEAIDNFIFSFIRDSFNPFEVAHILEPCAGDGAIIRRLKLFFPAAWITAIEIRPEEKDNLKETGADDVHCGIDFLKSDWRNSNFDIIITNPPYSIAQEIIEHCFEIAPEAEVIMLLRQGFLSSKARKSFWDKYPVTQLYPLAERPSFGASAKCKKCDWRRFYHLGEDCPRRCPECGANVQVSKTDACDYAWFVWSKYREPKIQVI